MKMEFKDKLRALRKERGLSRKKLAELTNISTRAVECYEQGIREPKYDTLERLAQALDVSAMELMGSIPKYLALFNQWVRAGLGRLYPGFGEGWIEFMKKFLDNLSYRVSLERDFPDRLDGEVSSHVYALLNALDNLLRPGSDFAYLEPYDELTSSVKTRTEWVDAVRADAARDIRDEADKILELLEKERGGRA